MTQPGSHEGVRGWDVQARRPEGYLFYQGQRTEVAWLCLRCEGAQRIRPEDLAERLPCATSQGERVELEGLRWGHFDCILGLAGPHDGKREAQYDFKGSGAGCGQGRALR